VTRGRHGKRIACGELPEVEGICVKTHPAMETTDGEVSVFWERGPAKGLQHFPSTDLWLLSLWVNAG
jgi:hypothetical protein